ncbi:YHYH domain-containing protein [Scandinavium lactucae]
MGIIKDNIMKRILLALFVLAYASSALAHSGGTNSEGCHTQHSTGEYHCHNKK